VVQFRLVRFAARHGRESAVAVTGLESCIKRRFSAGLEPNWTKNIAQRSLVHGADEAIGSLPSVALRRRDNAVDGPYSAKVPNEFELLIHDVEQGHATEAVRMRFARGLRLAVMLSARTPPATVH